MIRKQLPIKLNDNQEYIFSERNKIDSDYLTYQERVRASKVRFWEANLKDDDRKMVMIMQEARAFYTPIEIQIYVASNEDELLKVGFDSFKINYPKVPFEEFVVLAKDKIKAITDLIYSLESEGSDTDKKKEKEQK